GLVGAAEVLRLHADGLSLGLGLDGGVEAHVPFDVELVLGDAVGEGRAPGQRQRQLAGGVDQGVGLDQPVVEAP
ncbi:MAG: hypothetical protein KKB94_01345, partial [Proteobacteria bacterium]|nr:hypothetical protein [Pseudomonadota bacterium]